ncbi:aromatic ring-hydroxylating dioxygenase subunit alpha [Caulobacter sp. SL161]|uniref:aromatic ring-hydroxylating oxygenase subunit alpha n=1 Tax=Caulobacter sp. SL161 TaxID=2995156 RepID=UPI00227625E3|nr:aromatic ring-hydroxylating dioxygenase subunit alpha [Caulobacter sp. SL161]MCY1646761.1 aromatic ring-hydroxylating dioxygenase subunit alpha [Caulobacter sp. SL161]
MHSQAMPDDASKPAKPAAADKFGEGFVWDAWYVAALSPDLKPGTKSKREYLGEPVLLGRTRAGEVYAIRDICPHRAAALSAGRLHREADGTDSIECPYHGWRFGPDGACTAIPSLTADSDFDISKVRVRRYPTVEAQGLVWIWMSSDPRFDGAPPEPPPVIPGVVGGKPKLVDHLDYDIHIDHAVLGLIDPAHGPYVHQQWWWRTKTSQHEKNKRFAPSEAGFTMVRHEPSKNSKAYAILGGEPLTEITFRLPGLRWEHVTVGKKQVLALSAMTPINAHKTRMNQIMWSDHWAFTALYPIIRIAARAFLRQDGRIVENQTPGLKCNPPLMWVGDADQQARWYHQCKREWNASRREGRPFVNPVKDQTLRWRT